MKDVSAMKMRLRSEMYVIIPISNEFLKSQCTHYNYSMHNYKLSGFEGMRCMQHTAVAVAL